jgi:hypothetical protein
MHNSKNLGTIWDTCLARFSWCSLAIIGGGFCLSIISGINLSFLALSVLIFQFSSPFMKTFMDIIKNFCTLVKDSINLLLVFFLREVLSVIEDIFNLVVKVMEFCFNCFQT